MESLPQDLVSLILSRLAPPWVVQARLVCRSWRRLLSSHDFALLWYHSQRSLWLLLLHPSSSSAHLPHLSALHLSTHLCIPLPLHPPPFLSFDPSPIPPPPPSSSILASCDLGILVINISSNSVGCLSLINPLTRHFVRIPLPLTLREVHQAGVASSQSGFSIIAIGRRSDIELAAELYDSGDSAWRKLPPLPTLQRRHPEILLPRRAQSLVWWKGRFCVIWGGSLLTFNPGEFVTKAAEAKWESIALPSQLRIWDLRFLTLHAIADRLFIEGNFQEQGDFSKRYPLRVGVLELEQETMEWKEVGFMPEALSNRICKQQNPAHCLYTAYSDPYSPQIRFAPFQAQAHLQKKGVQGRLTETGFELVIFDVVTKSWTSIAVLRSVTFSGFPSFKGLTFCTTLDKL